MIGLDQQSELNLLPSLVVVEDQGIGLELSQRLTQIIKRNFNDELDQQIRNLFQNRSKVNSRVREIVFSKMSSVLDQYQSPQVAISMVKIIPGTNGQSKVYFSNNGSNKLYLYRDNRMHALSNHEAGLSMARIQTKIGDRLALLSDKIHQVLSKKGLQKHLSLGPDHKVTKQWIINDLKQKGCQNSSCSLEIMDVLEPTQRIKKKTLSHNPLTWLNRKFRWRSELHDLDQAKHKLNQRLNHLKRKEVSKDELVDLQEELRQLELDCLKREWWLARLRLDQVKEDRHLAAQALEIMRAKEMAYQELSDLA
ncbi:hypothetical protein ACFLZY_01225 [Patescibacteria group bacterium]